jgi:hypothetical protein
MPDIEALIRYIRERQIDEGEGTGYCFARGLPPNLRDTCFALGCLKILRADSPDLEVVKFISSHESFDLYGAYYAKNCLDYVGAEVLVHDKSLGWRYHGDKRVGPFTVPSTPLIKYFRCEVYGLYGSSIFSSTLSAVLKRIELGAKLDARLTKWAYSLLKARSS